MTETSFAVLMLLVLGWAVASHLLARVNITGALVFLVAGYLLGNPSWGPLAVDVEAPSVHLLAELTLALLLFSDASRVNVVQLRKDVYFPARLLGVGLPLSIILGSLAAAWMFDDFSWALAGFVGATLAPTDAALSAQVVNDERIPLRLRRALNVESGLNDGIATPIVVFTLAVARERPRTGRSRTRRRRRCAARARARRRRRPRGRARQRRPHRVRFEAAVDRGRRPAAGDARGRPRQLCARGRARRQRVHRGVRRRDRLRRRAAGRTSPTWRRSESCRS